MHPKIECVLTEYFRRLPPTRWEENSLEFELSINLDHIQRCNMRFAYISTLTSFVLVACNSTVKFQVLFGQKLACDIACSLTPSVGATWNPSPSFVSLR